MNTYINNTIRDVTMTATTHQLAAEHYRIYSLAIKYPMAIGPALVMVASFIGSIMGGNYLYYANQGLSLISLLTVAIDAYFGWSKLSVSHANVATQYFVLRDKLTRLKRQQIVRPTSTDIQPAVEKIEENFMALLQKHRRAPSSFETQALSVMRSTQSLVDAIDQRRRVSEQSKSKHSKDNKPQDVMPEPKLPAVVETSTTTPTNAITCRAAVAAIQLPNQPMHTAATAAIPADAASQSSVAIKVQD